MKFFTNDWLSSLPDFGLYSQTDAQSKEPMLDQLHALWASVVSIAAVGSAALDGEIGCYEKAKKHYYVTFAAFECVK